MDLFLVSREVFLWEVVFFFPVFLRIGRQVAVLPTDQTEALRNPPQKPPVVIFQIFLTCQSPAQV